MEYEIVRLDAKGDGYVVITRDDGTSFGQNMTGCTFKTRQEMDNYILDVMDRVDRDEGRGRVVVAPAVLNTVGTRIPIVRPAR